MSRRPLILLAGPSFVALLTIAAANFAAPQLVQIVLGGLIVFILPGFVLTFTVLPEWVLSRGERALASVGMSLAMSVCAAVLLAATPIGLSQLSLAVVLGGSNLRFVNVCGVSYWLRRLPAMEPRECVERELMLRHAYPTMPWSSHRV
jgi:uncharacterized membrane protein